jgi:hypothetical protein
LALPRNGESSSSSVWEFPLAYFIPDLRSEVKKLFSDPRRFGLTQSPKPQQCWECCGVRLTEQKEDQQQNLEHRRSIDNHSKNEIQRSISQSAILCLDIPTPPQRDILLCWPSFMEISTSKTESEFEGPSNFRRQLLAGATFSDMTTRSSILSENYLLMLVTTCRLFRERLWQGNGKVMREKGHWRKECRSTIWFATRSMISSHCDQSPMEHINEMWRSRSSIRNSNAHFDRFVDGVALEWQNENSCLELERIKPKSDKPVYFSTFNKMELW